jgi:hypothetical protein
MEMFTASNIYLFNNGFFSDVVGGTLNTVIPKDDY